MLYYLCEWSDHISWLRIFRYVTFRALLGAGTAFVLSLVLGPWVISALRRLKNIQPDRMTEAPQLKGVHKRKDVPTMGGLLILFATVISTVLWAIPGNTLVLLTLVTMVAMGAVGFADDHLKVIRKRKDGLPARWKLLAQIAWAVLVVLVLWYGAETHRIVSTLMIPFLKTPMAVDMNLAVAMIFILAVLVGCTNAVNLTDGLDGLAIGCTNSVALAYLVMAYVTGHAVFARYLQLPFIPGASELAVFCGCLLGAGLGFLWWNCHPARIFMGDTGSLAIGGALAMVAILVQQELTLILVGGVFVMEAMSVVIQVTWFKISGGKRVFRCAPIHHHFEKIGKENAIREKRDEEVVETMVTTRLWIVSAIFALIGLASLKIR